MIRTRRASVSLVTAVALSRLVAGCNWGTEPTPLVPVDPPPDQPVPTPLEPRSPRLDRALGETVTAASPPPPISGGTLLITRDDSYAIASDPDHDRVHVVDLTTHALLGSVGLQRGDEPGRAVEDASGRIHVVLRRGGAVVTFEPAERVISARREVCPSPRGVAYQPAADVIHVACQGGELVTLPASGGAATRTLHLDDDLRDVVWSGRQLFVTRFRSAEALALDDAGAVVARSRPAIDGAADRLPDASATGVAWRTITAPGGRLMMLHQVANTSPVVIEAGGYSRGGCGGSIVGAALSRLDGDRLPDPPAAALQGLTLAVDVAISPDGTRIAAAAPGNALLSPGRQLVTAALSADDAALPSGPCGVPMEGASVGLPGQVIAVAYTHAGRLFAQTREPGTVSAVFETSRAFLGGMPLQDTGHTIFHADAGGGIACASCHPEGNDDGRVWSFSPIGPRRTQSLRGGILGTEPFHWDGDMADFAHLTTEVLGSRMSGGPLSATRAIALSHWLDAQPALPRPAPRDEASATRGAALFHDPTVGCASCHDGDALTNNSTVDVGTGAAFQVPTLRGLKYRAPYMHDGCAPTLLARFTDATCGGGDRHGHTSQLSERDLSDLVAWLETQ